MDKKRFEKYLVTQGVNEAIKYIESYSKEYGMPQTSKVLGIPGKDLLLILSNPTSKEAKMKLATLYGYRFNHITGNIYQ